MCFIAAQLKIHPHLRGTITATLFVIFERYDLSCPKNIPLVFSTFIDLDRFFLFRAFRVHES